MKSIELKSTTEKLFSGGGERPVTTSELLRAIINSTPEGGFTPQEMLFRLRLLNALDSANGEMKIEDGDYEKLSILVKSMKWGVISQFIFDFVNEF